MPNWATVLNEIQSEVDDVNGTAADRVRRRYLEQLHAHTGRNIICYYSGWLQKPGIAGVEITDEDKNGFMLCIHEMDRSKGLDLLLHTPGGSGAATESLVEYLRQMFGNDIRAIVPQIAMSAGTIIACASKQIVMGAHSNLGPVDPQINGIAAYSVLAEIETAFGEIKQDPRRAAIWTPILARLTPGFVQTCTWAIQRSIDMVSAFLRQNMLAYLEAEECERTAATIVTRLTKDSSDKGHDKHIGPTECEQIGLNIARLEDDQTLQEFVLTVHHCFMFALSNTPAFKIIENHLGRRLIKQLAPAPMPMPFGFPMPFPPIVSAPPGNAVQSPA